MTGAAVVIELRRRGVRLSADGDTLRYVGPRAALSADLLRALREQKGWILGLLRVGIAARGRDIEPWGDEAEERAAILEHDGGFTREEAERRALEAVVSIAEITR